MSDEIRTYTDEERSQFGGDFAITRTIPRIHPTLGIRLKGTRDSIESADVQYHNFFRGDIWFRDNPRAEFNFAFWNLDNSSTAALAESRRHRMRLTKGGFRPCMFDEWELSDDLKPIYSNMDGMLAMTGGMDKFMAGGVTSCEVVMYRPAARLLEEEAKRNNAPTPDSLNAEAQKRIGSALTDEGVSVQQTEIKEIAHRFVPPDPE